MHPLTFFFYRLLYATDYRGNICGGSLLNCNGDCATKKEIVYPRMTEDIMQMAVNGEVPTDPSQQEAIFPRMFATVLCHISVWWKSTGLRYFNYYLSVSLFIFLGLLPMVLTKQLFKK